MKSARYVTIHILPMLLCLASWNGNVSADQPLTFENEIRPLLKARCFTCHGEQDKTEGGLDIRLVPRLRTGGDSGPAVVPGKRAESPLYTRLIDGDMPPNDLPKLTPQQIELIGSWIDAGAKSDRPESENSADEFITAKDREFWSFQPLHDSPLPISAGTRWGTGSVDPFILQKLEEAKLQPAPRADPRTLLRRLSFVLTGLPPTYEQVRQFEENPSVEKYAEHVDRLLASPQFGERWGRIWLDLVRYVDVTPNYLAGSDNAWRYRDWVIQSFNEDRPYDDFVKFQLAADQFPDATVEDLPALGLLGLSPEYWKELKLAPEVIRVIVADEWDERIDTVSRTFLGLSVACARCHNHKFDPISAEDYYAFAGVIASTQLVQKPILPPARSEVVYQARNQVAVWKAELKGKPATALESERDLLRAKIAAMIESTPDFHAPSANIVEDASVDVVPDGADATKLVMHRGQHADLPVFRRGNPEDHGPVIKRHFLSVLSPGRPTHFQHGSGRGELAIAMFREGRPLTARVMVNRIWAQVFGQGLVRTVSDFGAQGDAPTHPELLDYLALNFIRQNWSMKKLIRELVLSQTFQQSSHVSTLAAERDPSAQLLSHMPRRRLEIEAWRDALLKTTGQLDSHLGGPAGNLDDPAFRRRTTYGKVVREELNTMLRLFDFPEGLAHSPCRDQTITPMQQLFVLNGPLLESLAREYAKKLSASDAGETLEAKIRHCYQDLYQRQPTENELIQSITFLKNDRQEEPPTSESWESYLHVILSVNEMCCLD